LAILENMMDTMPSDFDIVDSLAIAYQGKLVMHETIRPGTMAFDAWVNNTNPDMHVLFSATKSLASLVVGIAIDQGIFSGVGQPYLAMFPYPSFENWDERKNDIVLEDVLTMRAGLEWNEWDPPYTSADNQMLRFYETEVDFSKSVLDLPMANDPGMAYAYNTPAVVSLGQAIENTASLSLIDFGIANVFGPMSISDVEVLTTPTGLPDIGRGLYLLTRDFLKFGQLLVNGGTWNGTRIVSEQWLDASVSPHVSLAWTDPDKFDWKLSAYGYLWWIGYFEYNGRQLNAWVARGHGEQNLFVIPELELVVAVFSHAFNGSDNEFNQTYDLISRFVIPALGR